MTYEATSVSDYVAQIPVARREAFTRIMDVIRANIPDGFAEGLSYGMPAFVIPHSIYPAGYHCKPEEPVPFFTVGNQKQSINLYHSGIYAMPDLKTWFEVGWATRDLGKLDMGKSCIRLRKIDRIPYDLIGELAGRVTVNEWLSVYRAAIAR